MHWAKIKLSRAIFLSPSFALCVLEKLRLRSGGSDEQRRSIRRRALPQVNEKSEAFGALHLIYIHVGGIPLHWCSHLQQLKYFAVN